jgi:hypothetical protein
LKRTKRNAADAVPGSSQDRTCLLNGQHPDGSDLAKECPVLQREKRRAKRLAMKLGPVAGIVTGNPPHDPTRYPPYRVPGNRREQPRVFNRF